MLGYIANHTIKIILELLYIVEIPLLVLNLTSQRERDICEIMR